MPLSRMAGMTLRPLLGLSALVVAASAYAQSPAGSAVAPLPDKVDFNRDIRPILSDNCYACHGPDAGQRKGDLRFDTKAGLFSDRKDGRKTLVAGKPDQSEIYRRITNPDPADRMPPTKFNKALTDRQVALVKKWIEQGAEWKGHWAYQHPERPEVPDDDRPGFVHNPIDRFVLARLKEDRKSVV